MDPLDLEFAIAALEDWCGLPPLSVDERIDRAKMFMYADKLLKEDALAEAVFGAP